MKKHILSLVLSLFVCFYCLGSEWGTPNYHIHVTAIASPSFICRGDSVRLSSWNCFCGVPPYTYNWTPTAGVRYDTARCTNAAPSHTTTYTITVTDANGVSGSTSVTVHVDSIHVSITGTNICLGSVGYLTANVSGSNNIPPYTYNWSPSGGTNATATIVRAGTYTVTITDSNGCSVTKSDSIKTSTAITVTDTVTSNVTCNGGSNGSAGVSVSGGTPPYTYSWSGGGSNSTKTGMTAGTYTVTLTDGCGATATAAVTITQPPPLIVNGDTCLSRFLVGDSLIAVGGTPPYTYSWSPPVSSASLLLLTDTTIFTLTVTDAHGCSTNSHATFIPTPYIASSCENLFISVYISDTLDNNSSIEIYNPAPYAIVLNNYVLTGTTNGSLFSPPFLIRLSGSIPAFNRYVVANSHADVALKSLANMLTDTLNFKGKDVVELAYIAPTISGVVVKLLDKIGDYSIPPTDSGWAVDSGSTKNHTLSRYVSVVEGDPDWTTCQSQWNVYPQGTFSELGHYENVCYPGDAQLYLQLTDTSMTCGDPGYFYFDILASADSAKHFNSCVMDINMGNEFYGDSVSNGGVTVTPGSDFILAAGNDYNSPNVINLSPTVIKITFGSDSESSPDGTIVDSIADTLFHVKLRIQKCQTSTISFTNILYTSDDYYTDVFPIMHIVSGSTADTICTSCIDCLCACSSSSSDLSCCCSDSIRNIPFSDTTYTYINIQYSTIGYIDSIPASVCPLSPLIIDNFTPKINAGTNDYSIPAVSTIPANNASILTINGSGFGSIKGTIKVTNANDTGMIKLDSVDIFRWSENLITVRMPSYLYNAPTATPGSGPFIVTNTCGVSATDTLQINYNIIDTTNNLKNVKLKPNIVMVHESDADYGSTESFIFRCDTSVSHNSQAYACVKKAIRTWNCWTGVNWKLGHDTALAKDTEDGISDIYFTNSFSLNNVMHTKSWYLPCFDGYDSINFKDEADIKIRRTLPSGYTWNYDTTSTVFSGYIGYFYDAILHELGHAHGLNHIIDTTSLMYRTQYTRQRVNVNSGSTYPGPATLLGGLEMVYTSVENPSPSLFGCSYNSLIPNVRYCTDPHLSVAEIPKNSYNLNVFPNPIHNGALTISYQLTENSYIQFKIFDCIGREIINISDEHKPPGTYDEQVNINALAGGVYLFIANINGECKTIKFIKI